MENSTGMHWSFPGSNNKHADLMGITVLRTNMYQHTSLQRFAELQDAKKCLEISTAFWHRFYFAHWIFVPERTSADCEMEIGETTRTDIECKLKINEV